MMKKAAAAKHEAAASAQDKPKQEVKNEDPLTFRGSADSKPDVEQESTKSEASAATSTSTANPFKDKNVF